MGAGRGSGSSCFGVAVGLSVLADVDAGRGSGSSCFGVTAALLVLACVDAGMDSGVALPACSGLSAIGEKAIHAQHRHSSSSISICFRDIPLHERCLAKK